MTVSPKEPPIFYDQHLIKPTTAVLVFQPLLSKYYNHDRKHPNLSLFKVQGNNFYIVLLRASELSFTTPCCIKCFSTLSSPRRVAQAAVAHSGKQPELVCCCRHSKHRCVNSRSPAPQLFVFQRLRQGQCVLDFFHILFR